VPDLLCVTGGWGISEATVFRGDGNGGFYPLPPEQNLIWENLDPEFADFSGDGIPDVLIFPNVYAGNGKGGFSLATTVSRSGSNISVAPVVVDINGDGKLDLVVPDGTHRFSVFLNRSGHEAVRREVNPL